MHHKWVKQNIEQLWKKIPNQEVWLQNKYMLWKNIQIPPQIHKCLILSQTHQFSWGSYTSHPFEKHLESESFPDSGHPCEPPQPAQEGVVWEPVLQISPDKTTRRCRCSTASPQVLTQLIASHTVPSEDLFPFSPLQSHPWPQKRTTSYLQTKTCLSFLAQIDRRLLHSQKWGALCFPQGNVEKPISQSPFSPFIPQDVSSFLHPTTPSPAPLVPIVFSKSWGKMPGNFLQANGCKENCTKTLQNYNPSVLI